MLLHSLRICSLEEAKLANSSLRHDGERKGAEGFLNCNADVGF
jgi:hypothetical protein